MDSEKGAIDSSEYYRGIIPESIFVENHIGSPSWYTFEWPVENGYQSPHPNGIYQSQPCKNFQSSLDKSDPSIVSRFNWTRDTKPDFSFSSNSYQPTCLNVNNYVLSSGTFGCKRKTKSPPPVPCKQHITEERMAEHMSQLHISSETQFVENEPVHERRLYMCEEMQRLQTESIIPLQILQKVQRPCTALIPWKPTMVLPPGNENNNTEEELDNNAPSSIDKDIMDTGLCEY